MRRWGGVLAGVMLVAGWLVAVGPAPAGATTTFTVTNASDTLTGTASNCTSPPTSTSCSLRDAFAAADAIAGPVEIDITAGLGTINLFPVAGPFTYNAATNPSLTVEGNGATITGSGNQIIDDTTSGPLTVDQVTIPGSGGGPLGALAAAGPVTVTNSTFTSDTTDGSGGAILGGSSVTVTHSTFTSDGAGSGGGGAISGAGAVTVTNSTFTGNFANTGGDGGAIRGGGAVTVTNSTFSDNPVDGNGGAIDAAGAVTVTNSTFSGNSAPAGSGGALASASVSVVYSTFTGNSALAAGSAIFAGTGDELFGSVLINPGGTSSLCGGPGAFTSLGYNYTNESAPGSCNLTLASDNGNTGNDPLLGGLTDNGGPTLTQLPQTGSPLIDAIASNHCGDGNTLAGFSVTTDQRSLPRPSPTGGACDIGAVEVQVVIPAAPVAVVAIPSFTG